MDEESYRNNSGMDLLRADGALNEMFLAGAKDLFSALSEKISENSIIICSRTCIGIIRPDAWMFNKQGDNLILKWNKDNESWENILPAAGIPLLLILSNNEYITGFYTDACYVDESETTIMIYKVIKHEQLKSCENSSGKAD